MNGLTAIHSNTIDATKTIKILHVEDSLTDAELIVRELKRDGLLIDSRRVETAETFVAELAAFKPDVILSDFSLPKFDGLSALTLAHTQTPHINCRA